jgi:hypothetical protein
LIEKNKSISIWAKITSRKSISTKVIRGRKTAPTPFFSSRKGRDFTLKSIRVYE